MDYLTILSTRSLILFPDASAIVAPSKPTHNRTYSSSSSDSLGTPTSSVLLLPPMPISIPLTSLIYGDTSTAYFLIQHVLSSSGAISHALDHDDADSHTHADAHTLNVLEQALGHGYGFSGMGGNNVNVSKELMVDAEVLVWKEMDKAKMFVRDLGASFGRVNGQGVRNEKALMELAGKHGLALKPVEHHQHDDEHKHAHDSVVEQVGKLSVGSGSEKAVMA